MSAVVEQPLVRQFDLLATAPGGVARLRELILTLAVQGKLVPQDPSDEPASVLLESIDMEMDRQLASGKSKRGKKPLSISDSEIPFELPEGWGWARLGRLANFIDYRGKTPIKTEVGIPLITAKNVRQGFIKREPREFIAESAFAGWMTRGFPRLGDLLFTTEAPLGNVAPIDITERFALAQRVICFGLYELKMSEMLVITLRSPWMQAILANQASGVTAQGIKSAQLQLILIPVPPLAEQSRIATRVKELMRLCDALERQNQLETAQHAQLLNTLLGTLTDCTSPDELAANWQRVSDHFDLLLDRPEAVDALEQTILQLAVRGLLVPQDPADEPASVLLQRIRAEKDRLIAAKKIKRDKPLPPINDEDISYDAPTGWEWVRVGELVNSSEAGWSPSCIGTPRRAGHWGVLKVSAVSWGKFDPEANKELPADLQPRPEYEVRPGDFLLSRANTAELVARSVVVDAVDARLMLSDKIIRLDVARLIDREYINFCNNSANARTYYAINASGTSSSMKNVSREVVLNLPIALPPLAEQTRIVARVTQLRDLCTTLRQRLAAAQTTQRHLAEALVEI